MQINLKAAQRLAAVDSAGKGNDSEGGKGESKETESPTENPIKKVEMPKSIGKVPKIPTVKEVKPVEEVPGLKDIPKSEAAARLITAAGEFPKDGIKSLKKPTKQPKPGSTDFKRHPGSKKKPVGQKDRKLK